MARPNVDRIDQVMEWIGKWGFPILITFAIIVGCVPFVMMIYIGATNPSNSEKLVQCIEAGNDKTSCSCWILSKCP